MGFLPKNKEFVNFAVFANLARLNYKNINQKYNAVRYINIK